MADLSDEEWFKALREKHGDKIHIGPCCDGGNPWHAAAYWEAKGLIGLYLDDRPC